MIAVAIAATAGIAVATLLTTSNDGSRPPAQTAPAAHATSPSPASSSLASTPKGTTTDRTATAAEEAHRVLRDWSAANPTGIGRHAVGNGPAAGAGGHIQEILRIPALGAQWAQPVFEGTGAAQLRAGVGHFEGTEEPGQVGNFAVAGHRSGVEAPPFAGVDRITVGAPITVTTANRITYTYRVTQKVTVSPGSVGYIGQVPGHPNAIPTRPEMTIVTCWPEQGHSKRVVIIATLVSKGGGL
ncbi:sortase [Streptomyces noursei]|uniref:sortase n=1 Tax=Streptomyces noursei TaxID=1971 RepID=UPI0015E0FB3A|nr:sortase [Streptomyces noursei]